MEPVKVTPPARDVRIKGHANATHRRTDEDTKIRSDEVKCVSMTSIRHDTRDTRQDGSETDDRVQRRDHLREFDGRDATSDECADASAHGCDGRELDESLRFEPDGGERCEDTGDCIICERTAKKEKMNGYALTPSIPRMLP